MPRSDGFLGRWSRRKVAARGAPDLVAPEPVVPELPAIETLTNRSDYTVFLQQGVSAVIQQQALRRAWESDATIAGFRGMADYDWDFNAPSYGRLWAADDVLKLVQDVLASPPAEAEAETMEAAAEGAPAALAVAGPTAMAAAVPAEAEAAPEPRRHGSALPG